MALTMAPLVTLNGFCAGPGCSWGEGHVFGTRIQSCLQHQQKFCPSIYLLFQTCCNLNLNLDQKHCIKKPVKISHEFCGRTAAAIQSWGFHKTIHRGFLGREKTHNSDDFLFLIRNWNIREERLWMKSKLQKTLGLAKPWTLSKRPRAPSHCSHRPPPSHPRRAHSSSLPKAQEHNDQRDRDPGGISRYPFAGK